MKYSGSGLHSCLNRRGKALTGSGTLALRGLLATEMCDLLSSETQPWFTLIGLCLDPPGGAVVIVSASEQRELQLQSITMAVTMQETFRTSGSIGGKRNWI